MAGVCGNSGGHRNGHNSVMDYLYHPQAPLPPPSHPLPPQNTLNLPQPLPPQPPPPPAQPAMAPFSNGLSVVNGPARMATDMNGNQPLPPPATSSSSVDKVADTSRRRRIASRWVRAGSSSTSDIPGIMVFYPELHDMDNFSDYVQYMEEQGAHEAGLAKVRWSFLEVLRPDQFGFFEFLN